MTANLKMKARFTISVNQIKYINLFSTLSSKSKLSFLHGFHLRSIIDAKRQRVTHCASRVSSSLSLCDRLVVSANYLTRSKRCLMFNFSRGNSLDILLMDGKMFSNDTIHSPFI